MRARSSTLGRSERRGGAILSRIHEVLRQRSSSCRGRECKSFANAPSMAPVEERRKRKKATANRTSPRGLQRQRPRRCAWAGWRGLSWGGDPAPARSTSDRNSTPHPCGNPNRDRRENRVTPPAQCQKGVLSRVEALSSLRFEPFRARRAEAATRARDDAARTPGQYRVHGNHEQVCSFGAFFPTSAARVNKPGVVFSRGSTALVQYFPFSFSPTPPSPPHRCRIPLGTTSASRHGHTDCAGVVKAPPTNSRLVRGSIVRSEKG